MEMSFSIDTLPTHIAQLFDQKNRTLISNAFIKAKDTFPFSIKYTKFVEIFRIYK